MPETIRESRSQDRGDFAELKRKVRSAGLLAKDVPYYLAILAQALVLFALAIVALAATDRLWLLIPEAVFLALACTQLGFIAHDAGHRQIFPLERGNDILGLLLVDGLLGFSYGWWVEKHNRHHAQPNHLDHDPDIHFPVVAFSPEQARAKRGFRRVFVRHQAWLFFPLLSLLSLSLRRDSLVFLRATPWRYRRTEVVLLFVHVALYAGFLVGMLGPWRGLLVGVIHQASFGILLGSVFAANHKGMPLVGEGVRLGYTYHQVVTSRNLACHPITDWWYGPLSCQIEHHLFPTMPRCCLRKAAEIVRGFCAERSIPYHETGVVESYREILSHLHTVGAPLRAKE